MQSRAVELLVGLFVCLGIAAIFILTMRVSNLADTSDVQGYTVIAAFDNTGGLKVGAPVNMAGVRIGRVADITLNQQTYRADARLRIGEKYKLPKDSDASVLTSGLLGEQYIGVGAGGSLKNMQDGDEFIITQSAVVLENLIGQFMTSMGGGASGSSSGGDFGGPPGNGGGNDGGTGDGGLPAPNGS